MSVILLRSSKSRIRIFRRNGKNFQRFRNNCLTESWNDEFWKVRGVFINDLYQTAKWRMLKRESRRNIQNPLIKQVSIFQWDNVEPYVFMGGKQEILSLSWNIQLDLFRSVNIARSHYYLSWPLRNLFEKRNSYVFVKQEIITRERLPNRRTTSFFFFFSRKDSRN